MDTEGYSLECIKNERRSLEERRRQIIIEERRLASIESQLYKKCEEELRTFEWTRGLTAKLGLSVGRFCTYRLLIDEDIPECPASPITLLDRLLSNGEDHSLRLMRQAYFADKWNVETRSLEVMLEFISKSHFKSIEYDKKLRMLFDRIDIKYFSMGIPRVNRPYPEL